MSSHATTFSPSADSKTKGLEANDPDELASSICTVANRAALEGKNAAAIITRCFKGNQLLDTIRYEQCKATCSESTNKNIQNNWRGTMDVEVILRDQLRTNDEISTTMFISDYGETSTQTDTNENMVDICSFLKEHIYEHSSTNRGRYSRETPQYIKLKYEHLDLTRYSVDLVRALRDIVDLYKSQIHALIEPLLDKTESNSPRCDETSRWRWKQIVTSFNVVNGKYDYVGYWHTRNGNENQCSKFQTWRKRVDVHDPSAQRCQ